MGFFCRSVFVDSVIFLFFCAPIISFGSPRKDDVSAYFFVLMYGTAGSNFPKNYTSHQCHQMQHSSGAR